jgi:lambda repressor-like predicted transcriptional regulator
MQRYREEYHRCCGDPVRKLRTEKGWSLADFSREAGISASWLRKFEENKLTTNYSMRIQMQMVQALGFGVMEIHQFYKRVDEMTEASAGPALGLRTTERGTCKMGESDGGSSKGTGSLSLPRSVSARLLVLAH